MPNLTYHGFGETFNDDGSTTAVQATAPAGGVNDVLIAYCDTNGGAGTAITTSSVTGGGLTWTKVGADYNYNTAANVIVYHSSQLTSASAVTVTMNASRAAQPSSGQSNYLQVFRYSGAGGVVSSSSANSGGSQATTISGGSLTIDSGNTSVLFVRQTNNFGQTFTPPTNWTEDYDPGEAKALYRRDLASTGAQDPSATSSNNWFGAYGVHLEVAPPTVTDFLNPASDVTVNSWTTDTGGATDLYQAIDEDTASDTDYVQSPLGAFTSSYYECGLQSQAGDAGLSTGHVVSYRYQASLGAGSDVTVSLRQGAGTEIAAWTHNNIGTSWVTADQTLTGTQADNITYPTDLRIRLEPNADGPGTPTFVANSGASTQNKTTQASTTITVTSGMASAIQVGHYMVAWIAADNSGSAGAAPGLTLSDPRNGTWTLLGPTNRDPGAANAGVTIWLAYVKVTTVYQTNDLITLAWTNQPPNKTVSVGAFSGIDGTNPIAVSAGFANNANTALSISITPSAADQLVVVVAGIEGPSTDTWTDDSDTTNGSWTAITEVSTGSAGTDTEITMQGAYKRVTASGAQTWNSTITLRDWGAVAVVFAPQLAARVQVSWAGLTIPYAAAPPPGDRPSARSIYQPAVQRAALW